jgi:CarD family transcriptional regulator
MISKEILEQVKALLKHLQENPNGAAALSKGDLIEAAHLFGKKPKVDSPQTPKPSEEPPKQSLQATGKGLGSLGLQVGQAVRHKTHGMGSVTGYETRELSPGRKSSFYVIGINDRGAQKKVFVPEENAKDRITTFGAAEKQLGERVHAFLKEPHKAKYQQTWNQRYRQYMDDAHSGDPMRMANTYKDLMQLYKEKDLSFGERKMLDMVANDLDEYLHASTGKRISEE